MCQENSGAQQDKNSTPHTRPSSSPRGPGLPDVGIDRLMSAFISAFSKNCLVGPTADRMSCAQPAAVGDTRQTAEAGTNFQADLVTVSNLLCGT